MLPEVTRLWLNRYDVQVTIARLFQNVNLRILDCTRARWRGLDLLGEKRQIKEKAKWRQNQIQCGYLFTATWRLRTGKQS